MQLKGWPATEAIHVSPLSYDSWGEFLRLTRSKNFASIVPGDLSDQLMQWEQELKRGELLGFLAFEEGVPAGACLTGLGIAAPPKSLGRAAASGVPIFFLRSGEGGTLLRRMLLEAVLAALCAQREPHGAHRPLFFPTNLLQSGRSERIENAGREGKPDSSIVTG